MALAKEQGKYVSVDPNLRKPLWASEEDAKAAIEWSLRQAEGRFACRDSKNWTLVVTTIGASQFSERRCMPYGAAS